jgi:hypothetical protein
MNTGIGDAVNLSWKLACAISGRTGPGVLDSYEPERIAFARRLVATTDRAFTLVTRSGALAAFVRRRVLPVVIPRVFSFVAMRRFLFRTVSQIGIAYPDSTLSSGSAGKIRGGDRLPWVPVNGTADNFTPLTSMAWQAHIYGEPRVSAKVTCAELGVPLHVFAWTSDAKRAGLERSAFYLVRPDGYVALADSDGGAQGLRRYLVDRELSPGAERSE